MLAGSKWTRLIRPPALGIWLSPTTRFVPVPTAVSISAVRTTFSNVEGSTRPRMASTRPAARSASSKLPVIPIKATRSKLPKAWPLNSPLSAALPLPLERPPKRYCIRWVIKASSLERAAMLLRKSPGGSTPSSSRKRPLLPPSSATVTMAVMLLVYSRSPRSKLGIPVPPPIATIRGPRFRWV